MIRNIKYVVTSTLDKLMQPRTGRYYNWVEQRCIEYLAEVAPMNGQCSLKVWNVPVDTAARQATLPSDCLRISNICLKSGRRLWKLTVDPNLAIPESLFSCDTDEDESNRYLNTSDFGVGWWWGSTLPTLGGGQNSNYYRINGRTIVFDHNIEAGNLIIEYMSNGDELSANTIVDMAYVDSIRWYLMAEFEMVVKNNMQKYKEYLFRHEGQQWNSNFLVNAPRMSELIDAMAQSSSFNLG